MRIPDLRERPAAAAAAGLVLLVSILFGPALAGRGVYFQRDILQYCRPQVDSLLRVLAEGAPPVWNPYFEVGLPLLADPGYQLFYPPQWGNLVVPPARFYAIFVAAHALFAGLGAFALARAWGMRAVPAFVLGAAFLASGPYLSLVPNPNQMGGASWIPWVLLLLERSLSRPSARAAALVGTAAALQLLAGSGDYSLMTAQLAAARLILWLARAPLTPGARLRSAARVSALAGGMALALGAVLWVPTAAIIRAGGRAHMDPQRNAYWSVHPANLVDLVVPQGVASLPLRAEAREELFEGREPFLPSLYGGAATALLAVLGLQASRGRGYLLLAVAAALLAASLGRHAFVYSWVLHLPGVSLFRYPVKYVVPATLFWMGLAAFGVATLDENWTSGQRRLSRFLGGVAIVAATLAAWSARAVVRRPEVLAAIAVDLPTAARGLRAHLLQSAAVLLITALLLLLRASSPRPVPGLTAAAAALLVGDVLLGARGLNPIAPPALASVRPPLLEHIRPRADGFPTRVLSRLDDIVQMNGRVVRGPAGWDREWSFALGLQEHLLAPTGARWGLGGAYDGDFTGLAPEMLSAYSAVVRHPRAGPLAVNLLRAGGIDYVVTLAPRAFGLTEVAAVASVYDAPVRLFAVPGPVPRVHLARPRRVADRNTAWEALADPRFDPAREVVIVGGAAPASPGGEETGRLTLVSRRADLVVLDVDGASASVAVLGEMHAPGWTARVDGTEVPVLTADLLFCAAEVPAGRHRVEFEYRAPGARAGLAAGALGLSVLAVLFTGPRRPKALPAPAPSATIAGP